MKFLYCLIAGPPLELEIFSSKLAIVEEMLEKSMEDDEELESLVQQRS
jgi:hypothetical protein